MLYQIVRIGEPLRASLPPSGRHLKQRNFLTIIFSVEGCGEEPTEKGKDISLFLDRRSEFSNVDFPTILLLYFNIIVVYNVRVGYNCGHE